MFGITTLLLRASRSFKLDKILPCRTNNFHRLCQAAKLNNNNSRSFSIAVSKKDQVSEKKKIDRNKPCIEPTFKTVHLQSPNRNWSTYFWEIRSTADYSDKIVTDAFDKNKFRPYQVKENAYMNILEKLEDSIKENRVLTAEEVGTILDELLEHGKDREINERLLNWLDWCCSQNEWSLENSFYIFDALNIITGDWFLLKHTYNAFARGFWLDQPLNNSDLCLALYFVSLPKSKTPAYITKQFYKKFLSSDLNFTLPQWVLFCHSFFKMSLKIDNQLVLHSLCRRFNDSFEDISNFDKITILKLLRQASYYDKDLVEKMTKCFGNMKGELNLAELAHILSFFSNLRIYDSKLFTKAEKCFIDQLNNPTLLKNNSEGIRIKDLSRIVWSFCAINHTPQTQHFYNHISLFLKNNPKLFNDPDNIIDIAQSLVISNTYSKQILETVLDKSFYNKIMRLAKVKPKHQYGFLYESVKIEAPDYIPKSFMPDLSKIVAKSLQEEKEQRQGLTDLNRYMKEFTTFQSKLAYPLPHFSLSSIIFSVDQTGSVVPQDTPGSMKVAVELLDPTVCLRDSCTSPIGLMSVKIRQLKKVGYFVICVDFDLLSELKKCSIDQRNSYFSSLIQTHLKENQPGQKSQEIFSD